MQQEEPKRVASVQRAAAEIPFSNFCYTAPSSCILSKPIIKALLHVTAKDEPNHMDLGLTNQHSWSVLLIKCTSCRVKAQRLQYVHSVKDQCVPKAFHEYMTPLDLKFEISPESEVVFRHFQEHEQDVFRMGFSEARR